MLTDSGFSNKGSIQAIRQIKSQALHVVCGVRKDKRQYLYQGKKFDVKALYATVKKEGHAVWPNTQHPLFCRRRRHQTVPVPIPVSETMVRVFVHGHVADLFDHDGNLRDALDDCSDFLKRTGSTWDWVSA